ncbi:TonB-dependent receptor [Variovorax dokdonensis]|uniref:TonB-dependent receptor n=1 Tax=Variovorax dokdonensis TaxID=344883 RepID=A0ABT7NDJ4_9BURK|nr:TonB-dependent receptor [Variovorax dokdonensis]
MKNQIGKRRVRSLRAEQPISPNHVAKGSVALGISTMMLAPLAAFAQAQAPAAPSAVGTMEAVTVEAQRIDPNPNAEVGAPYKAKTSGDFRHTKPLAETPQTIEVITGEAIKDSGLTDLKQILDAVPGITLGTGENGNSFGDRYIIRGQEARSDVFVDGLRDPGMTTRETFAIEQLEISKGPNSTFAGRGSAGGAINAITKQATLDYDFTHASVGLGTDDYKRVTIDMNKAFSDSFALRANALYGDEGVPDRDPSERSRKGLALSGLWEVNKDLSVTLDYYGLRAKDSYPDLGSYLVGTAPNRWPKNPVPPVYAQAQDFQESDVDTFTARVMYAFSPTVKLQNLTRYGQANNGYVVTGARESTVYPLTGPRNAATAYQSGTLSTHNGWQDIDYFANQTNLRWDTTLGGMKNQFVFTLEYSDNQSVRGNYNISNLGATNCRTAATGAATGYCTQVPGGASVNGLNTLMNRSIAENPWSNDWRVKTWSGGVMDTIDFTERLSAFGGIRFDRYEYELGTRNLNTGIQNNYSYSDTLTNGQLGLTYKINPMGMVYGAVGSAADINGGEADTGTSAGYGGLIIDPNGNIGAKPEKSLNWELGTKWNIMDDKLLATAALFQTTKSDVMEGNGYESTGSANSGKNRVRGVEFGVTGNFTKRLQGQIGAAFMKSEVLESAVAANVGRELANFANNSISGQLKYQATPAFYFGGGFTYQSEMCAGQPDTGAGYTADGYCSQRVQPFTVYDLFAGYRINKNLELRAAVLNLFDKEYYTAAYRSGSFLYKGDGRAFRVTMDIEF